MGQWYHHQGCASAHKKVTAGSIELEIFGPFPVGDVAVEAGQLEALDRDEDLDEVLAEALAHRRVGLQRVERGVERGRQLGQRRIVLARRLAALSAQRPPVGKTDEAG